MEKSKITISYKNNEKRSHVHKLIYNSNEKLKKFHITITKSQVKAVSKLGDLEFIGFCQPFNVKILNVKPYKDSNAARLTLGYSRVRDLVQFIYNVGYLECLLDTNDQ